TLRYMYAYLFIIVHCSSECACACIVSLCLSQSQRTPSCTLFPYTTLFRSSPSVPSKGSLVVVTLARVLQSPDLPHPIDQLEVQTSNFIPLGPKTSLFSDLSGGTTFRGSAGPLQVFQLGGPFHLGAYFPDEFLGDHYAYASLGFRRELYRLPQLVGRKIYWGGWYEAGTAFGVLGSDPGPVVVRG